MLSKGQQVILQDTGQRAIIESIECYPQRFWNGKKMVWREGNLIKRLVVSLLGQNGHQNGSKICREITPDLIEDG